MFGLRSVFSRTRKLRSASPAPETSPNVPVIVRQKGVNECRVMQWGLIPHWAADPSIGNRMINARDGFYEWRKEGRRKVPMWVHLKSKDLIRPCGIVGRLA